MYAGVVMVLRTNPQELTIGHPLGDFQKQRKSLIEIGVDQRNTLSVSRINPALIAIHKWSHETGMNHLRRKSSGNQNIGNI